MTVKRDKLDLLGFAVFVKMNHHAYVSCFQTRSRDWHNQYGSFHVP
jgi:hypothetical protein